MSLISIINNSTTEHDTTKLMASIYSDSPTHSNDINSSHYPKLVSNNPYCRLLANFCQFRNVLKTLIRMMPIVACTVVEILLRNVRQLKAVLM